MASRQMKHLRLNKAGRRYSEKLWKNIGFVTVILLQKKITIIFLCLLFRASLIYINYCPMRCNTKQSIYYSASSPYMFRVPTPPIIRSTQNCNYSLRYRSYFLYSYRPPTWPSGHVEIKDHSNEEIKGTIVNNNIWVALKKYYLNSKPHHIQ